MPPPPPPASPHSRALLMLVLATLFWGLSFPIIKTLALLQVALAPGAGPWFAAAWLVAPRFLVATLLIALWQGRDVLRITRDEWKQGVVIGLFAAGGMLLQNDGLQFTAASTSAFLTQFYAILIPVYLALRARRRPRPKVWLSCVLVLGGVAVLGHFDWRTFSLGRGEWETLVASVFFMGQILWLEKKEFAANRAGKITFVTLATQALVFVVLAVTTAPRASALVTSWTSPAWLALTAVLAIVCTIGAYGLMNAWQPKISATEAGLIYCVEPIFAALLSLFLPALFSRWGGVDYSNERATMSLLVGGGLITLANVLVQWKPPTRAA